MQRKSSILLFSLVLILLFSTCLFAFLYLAERESLALAQKDLARRDFNKQTLDFAGLFINEVLRAKGEVDFEKRLMLENAVRGLNDAEIKTQWTKFVNSQSESDAQAEVKNLLALLFEKIKID